MSIFFCNKDEINLDAIRIMGVSVKAGDTPIGYFGTGLKFAIATLLRNNQSIKLTRSGHAHAISAETREIRGEVFDVVTLDGEPLGFTTQLGRNWEVWQAYRELHSNCLDESGTITTTMPDGEFGTVIEIDGDLCRAAYDSRDTIFLSTAPVATLPDVLSMHPGESNHGFYRGIRATTLQVTAMFTYNLIHSTSLTEDRTLASSFSLHKGVVDLITSLDDEELLEKILLASRDTYEGRLDFEIGYNEPSAAFMRICGKHRTNLNLNPSASVLWRSKQSYSVLYEPVKLNALNEQEIEEAMGLLELLDCTLTRDDFIVVESLGGAFYGVYREGFILIDRKTLDKGPRFIAGTLYEEWVHKTHAIRDCSREFQNMLLDKLLFFVDRTRRAES